MTNFVTFASMTVHPSAAAAPRAGIVALMG
jgi:hypothetical protein